MRDRLLAAVSAAFLAAVLAAALSVAYPRNSVLDRLFGQPLLVMHFHAPHLGTALRT